MNPAPGGAAAGQPLNLLHEINLMPMVLELIESIPNSSDQQEVNRKVVNFRAKMQACKDLVNRLPGLDCSPEEQERELQELKKELARKQELLDKFRSLEALTANAVKKETS